MIGQRAFRARCGCLCFEQCRFGFSIAVLVEQVIRPEEIAVDPVRVQLQRALEQGFCLIIVAKADRPTGHLIIECAEAGIGRAVECFGINRQRFLQFGFGLFDLAQRTQTTFGPGPAAENDAVPD